MVKMTGGFVALVVGAFLLVAPLQASADSRPALTRQQAVQAAGDRLDARADRTKDVVSSGIDRCVRRSRSAFACRASLVTRANSGVVDCGLSYRVHRRRGAVKTTMTRIRCESKPADEPGGPGLPIGPRDPDNPFQEGPGPKYCPGFTGAGTWDAKPDIVGKTYAEAIPIAAEHGCQLRIVRIDGEDQVITMDLRYNRLNVEVEGPDRRIVAIDSVA